MVTPEQWVDGIIKHIENPMFPGFTVLMPIAVIREALIGVVTAAIRAAINDRLEEVAVELKKLEEGVYTSAQTGSGLVRAMKVK